MPLDKPFEEITEDDLQVLQAPEGKTIEYKSSVYGNADADKKEFLKDVSAFANAAGGHLILGITEQDGVPVQVNGLAGINPDNEILRMENMLADNIEPRIPGISMGSVPLANGNVIIIIRIPPSWNQPHVVNFRGHWRFYSRRSANVVPLDVSELRTAFTLSATIAERIRLFRAERLGKIVAGETPVNVGSDSAKMVLHIIPFNAFDPSVSIDPASLSPEHSFALKPIGQRVHDRRYNLDGLLNHCVSDPAGDRSYLQLFRNGIIESVDISMLRRVGEEGDIPFIPIEFERNILEVLPVYFRIQNILGVTPPLFIMLSLLNVFGYVMGVGRQLDPFGDHLYPIDRDTLILPEVIVESFEAGMDNTATVMRPIFDSVWNATGWEKSINYNDAGEWEQRRNR